MPTPFLKLLSSICHTACLVIVLQVTGLEVARAEEAAVSEDEGSKEGYTAYRKDASPIYLLSAEITSVNENTRKLLSELGLDSEQDWQLTEYVRDFANMIGENAVQFSTDIQRWNPDEDPYNFGIIEVSNLGHNVASWTSGNKKSITNLSVQLQWVHVGNDLRTRYSVQKIPEIRFAVSELSLREFLSDAPPTPQQIAEFYKKTFEEGLENLLTKVSKEYSRTVNRNVLDVRYVSVATPVVLDRAKDNIQQYYPHLNPEQLFEDIPVWISGLIEDELMERFQNDNRFDGVVLLPNPQVSRSINAGWPLFAKRVAASSKYSANIEAMGKRPPQLLKLLPLCDVGNGRQQDNQVTGFEVKTNLAGIRRHQAPATPGVTFYSHSFFLAADVKIPVAATSSIQSLPEPQPPIVDNYNWELKIPDSVPEIDVVGPFAIPAVMANLIDQMADDISNRLLESLQYTPPLSHPKMQRLCQ